jgi:FkbM family methyltransferase
LGAMLQSIKRQLRRMGLEVRRARSPAGPLGPVLRLIQREGISLVFDVGANAGQFAEDLRHMGYRGRMVSFEPVAEAHRALLKTAGGDPLWTVAPRMALGEADGEVAVKVAFLSGLSSVLDPTPSHVQSYSPSTTVATETVPYHRLDTLAGQYLQSGDRALLKIDVQGFEKQVLEGAESLLETLRAVYLEVSVQPLYQGQALAREILDHLERRGYEIWHMSPGWFDPLTDRTLQYDVLLAKGTGCVNTGRHDGRC